MLVLSKKWPELLAECIRIGEEALLMEDPELAYDFKHKVLEIHPRQSTCGLNVDFKKVFDLDEGNNLVEIEKTLNEIMPLREGYGQFTDSKKDGISEVLRILRSLK